MASAEWFEIFVNKIAHLRGPDFGLLVGLVNRFLSEDYQDKQIAELKKI